MLPTLEMLVAQGAYVNAGHLDYYDGNSHLRLGEVNIVDGEQVVAYSTAGSIAASAMTLVSVQDAFEVHTSHDVQDEHKDE